MQLEAGRLQRESVLPIWTQVDLDLMCGAWTRRCDASAEPGLDCTVDMTAYKSLHLRVTRDDKFQSIDAIHSAEVHMLQARCKRSVMHHDQGRRMWPFCQCVIEPRQPLGTQHAPNA